MQPIERVKVFLARFYKPHSALDIQTCRVDILTLRCKVAFTVLCTWLGLRG